MRKITNIEEHVKKRQKDVWNRGNESSINITSDRTTPRNVTKALFFVNLVAATLRNR